MIFFFVPETKQRTLEELDYIFAVPGKKFIAYQTGKAAPWWLKRYILWQRDAKLEPLYVSRDLAFSFRNSANHIRFLLRIWITHLTNIVRRHSLSQTERKRLDEMRLQRWALHIIGLLRRIYRDHRVSE
jgi:hypothetical protein